VPKPWIDPESNSVPKNAGQPGRCAPLHARAWRLGKRRAIRELGGFSWIVGVLVQARVNRAFARRRAKSTRRLRPSMTPPEGQ
jgi:hypothetical protein